MYNFQFFNGIHYLYTLWANVAAQQIRTHEDGHVPSGVQPLQVAILRKAITRSAHPARPGGPPPSRQKVAFRPPKSNFSPNGSLPLTHQKVAFRAPKSYFLFLPLQGLILRALPGTCPLAGLAPRKRISRL